MYFMLLSSIVASFLLFTSKTESSRVVTIHRPMVITQERKTPAYYLYQQAKKLQQQKTPDDIQTTTTYLSSQSALPVNAQIKVAEMKFSRHEILQQNEARFNNVAVLGNTIKRQINNLAYENVIASGQAQSPIVEHTGDATALSPSKKWATIKGKLELIEGVGIVDHRIELKRIEEGKVKEIGSIDLSAGAYSIDIESPQGYLIVQIKDKNGGLIGEDRERLVNLQSRGTYIEGPFMRVGQPETLAANLPSQGSNRIASNAVGLSKMASKAETSVAVTLFDNQNTLEKANDLFTNVSTYSSTITRIFDPSRIYANLTTLRHTGDKTQTPLLTSKWIDGVMSYISDVQKIEFQSKAPVIIGRVLIDGKAISGAQVQIENIPGLEPIYFDQFMIPALTQNATSENGYFMFIGLTPSVYNVIAARQNIELSSQLFVVEDDAIAFQNIQSLSIPRAKIVRSYDAFTSEPIDADISSGESESVIETVSGSAQFQTYSDMAVSEYIVRSQNRQYVPLRYVQNSRHDYVHIPLIQENWLASMKSQRLINELPGTGMIIGFAEDLSYDAYLVAEGYNQNNVVYFDESGRYSLSPVAGGGFILFNVPVGAREVILQDRVTQRIYSQVFNVMLQQLSVAHFPAE